MSFIAGYLMGLSESGGEKAKLETLTATSNGIYYPPTDADGYNVVIVDVPTEADYDNYTSPHGVKTEDYTVEMWAAKDLYSEYYCLYYGIISKAVVDGKYIFGARSGAATNGWAYWSDGEMTYGDRVINISGFNIDSVKTYFSDINGNYCYEITFTYSCETEYYGTQTITETIVIEFTV